VLPPDCHVFLDGSCEGTLHALDLSNTRPQYLALDPNDGLVAVDVLLRQEPDDEEDDEEEEDRSHDEDEDDDYGNDDGYSERPSARVIDSVAPGETVVLGSQILPLIFHRKLNCLPKPGARAYLQRFF
jgi:hypothetical protein